MQTLSEIRALLAARGLRPRRRLGQHFLHDACHLIRLVEAAAVAPGDVVLEVGPGTGALTEALLERGARVVAVELDPQLASIVADRLGPRVTLIRGDCLAGGDLSAEVVAAIGGRPFKLVSNLPYQVAGTLVGVLLVAHPECRGVFVTVQREVAQRLLAAPGSKDYGALTVIVGALAEVRRIGGVPPGCFWPVPGVDSAMCAIVPRRDGVRCPAELARFVRELFRTRRKQLGTILGRDFAAWPAGVSARMRPGELTVDQVVELWRGAAAPPAVSDPSGVP